ncbi:MAG: NUDIX domain-containing protein [Bacteroidetes bacterium]|nr:NUDIX domain-containing protein [Bacteroidota bacterium]
MSKKSAGILLYRFTNKELQVMLVHPGGPFWKNKDDGSWSIPKGEFTDEDPLSAAIREFREEMGMGVDGEFIPLSPVKQKSGKLIFAFALEHDIDVTKIKSNHFELEWPPHSGKKTQFPEIDRADWFFVDEALKKMNAAQANLIKQLMETLHYS